MFMRKGLFQSTITGYSPSLLGESIVVEAWVTSYPQSRIEKKMSACIPEVQLAFSTYTAQDLRPDISVSSFRLDLPTSIKQPWKSLSRVPIFQSELENFSRKFSFQVILDYVVLTIKSNHHIWCLSPLINLMHDISDASHNFYCWHAGSSCHHPFPRSL